MIDAIKEWVVPPLFEVGFKGVFPHYCRQTPEVIELIYFHFSGFDQSFCIEVAKAPTTGVVYKDGLSVAPSEVTVVHCPVKLVLGAKDPAGYFWFKFNPTNHELKLQEHVPFIKMYKDTPLKYKKISEDILMLLGTQAKRYWEEAESWWEAGISPYYNRLFMEIHADIEAITLRKGKKDHIPGRKVAQPSGSNVIMLNRSF